MKKYLLIENKGEIDINSLILMGGSTKRNDPKAIGRFGSGNKYAIATLLKNGIDFKIFAGEKQVEIRTEKVKFRDVELDKIFIDGVETSLTMQMGPDWIEWFAIREQLSNAVDEGECNIVSSTDIISGKEGKTRFYLELVPKIQEVVDNWDTYFTQDRIDCLEENKYGKIFINLSRDNSVVLFRKGIRSYDSKTPSLYHYDCPEFEINESRVIASTYGANQIVSNTLAFCKNEQVIRNVLKNAYIQKTYENTCWSSIFTENLGPVWRKAIGNHRIIVAEVGGWYEEEARKYDCYIVTDTLAKMIKRNFPDVVVYGVLDDGTQEVLKKSYEMGDREKFLLKECDNFFKETSYSVDYPIEVVDFEDEDTLGLAESGTIYLSRKLFNMGKREIAVTIVEENEHLKTKFKDCSRALQQHFINMFISTLEEKNAYFL